MSEWPMMKLGDLGEFINGFAFKPSDWSENGTPIIRIQNLTNPQALFNRTTKRVKDVLYVEPGDLLVSWSATLGVFRWQGKELAVLNQHIFKVVSKPIIENEFLEFSLKFALQQVEKYLHGATMRHVNRQEFLDLKIPLPPLGEQKRIAEILGGVSKAIHAVEQQLQLVESACVNSFERKFNLEMQNGARDASSIADFIESTQYGTSKKAKEDGNIPILRMGNVTYSGKIDMTDLKYIDLDERELEKFSLKNGDLLFNRTNSVELVGKTAVFESIPDQIISYAGYLVRARVNADSNPYYVSGYLNSPSGKAQLRLRAKAIVGMANINAREFLSLEIPAATKEEQEEFAHLFEKCEKIRHLLHRKLSLLQELQKSLATRAFAGLL